MTHANSKRLFMTGILILLLVTAWVYRDLIQVDKLQIWLDAAGYAGPVVYIVIYALAAVLFIPGLALTLIGGALFGPVFGTLYSLVGATLGGVIAFVIARYLAADWVRAKSGERLTQLLKGIDEEGWRFVAFVRLVPLFPYNLLNYTLGVTKISLLQYTLASFIFMAPGSLAYTYLGYVGSEAAQGSEGLIQKGLLAVALLSLVYFLPGFIKRVRQQNADNEQ